MLGDWLKKNQILIFVILILAVGIYARFIELAWHFASHDDLGVAKSILEVEYGNRLAIFAISEKWTYSPFQYLITPFLISLEQSYRQVLFWGRLPSCIFGISGLLSLIWFYQKYEKGLTCKVLLPLVLLAVSWENIIFAKQMHNYALGVTASILVLVLLMHNLDQKAFMWKWTFLNGLILGVLCTMQYTIIFLTPGFYLLAFMDGLKKTNKRFKLFLQFLVSGLMFVLSVFPLWYFFIRKLVENGNRGLSQWNVGHKFEYVLRFVKGDSFWDNCVYLWNFFTTNSFLIFRAYTGFLWEYHWLFERIYIILLLLFFCGLISYFVTKNFKKRIFGLYYAIFILIWIGLLIKEQVTFSPTRHTGIFLPFFVFTISEGVSGL